MSAKKGKISTKRLGVALLSLVMIAGLVVLFVAASNNKKEDSCRGIVITVDKTSNGTVYVDTANIRKQLLTKKKLNPIGKTLKQLDIPTLENLIGQEDWVKGVEAYLGNHDLLYLKITQRVPVARVFTKKGNSFYLDKSEKKMPASGHFAIQLPVFTNYQEDKKDSTLLTQIKNVGEYIEQHHLWSAQIEQIKIDQAKGFEMTPQVGDVVIVFGDGNRIAEKFDKLLVFYKNGLNNVGWGYYDTLDLRFKGQVVASKKKREDDNPVVTVLLTHNDSDQYKEIRKEIAADTTTSKKDKTLAASIEN